MTRFVHLCILVALTTLATTPFVGHAMAEDLRLCASAKQAFDAGSYSNAISLYNQCINEGDLSQASHACAVLNRGRCYLESGQPDKGAGDVQSAVSMHPAFGEAKHAAHCLETTEAAADAILSAEE